MKKFKKVLICAAACATACSVTALTACTNNQPSDGLSTDVKVSSALTASALDEQIARFDNASLTALTVSGGVNMTKVGTQTVEMPLAAISGKALIEHGNADIVLSVNPILVQDGDTAPDTGAVTQAEEAATDMLEISVYLRGWKAFFPDMEGGSGNLEYADLAAEINNSANMVMGELITMATEGFMQDNEMLLKLANSTDSIVVSESEHTITLDINKMVYGLYGYIKQIVDNLNANTTLSGLLKCSAVKYYVETFTAGMTAQEFYDSVMEAVSGSIGGGSGGTTPFADIPAGSPLAAIMPLQNESVYNYIVRLLNSQDVADLIGAEKPLGTTKIVDLLGEDAAAALDAVKAAVGAIDGTVLTATSINIPAEEGMESSFAGMSISNIKMVYTFNAQNVLQSVAIGGGIQTTVEEDEVEAEFALEVSFVEKAALTAFEDIDGLTVNVRDDYGTVTGTTTVGALVNGSAAE